MSVAAHARQSVSVIVRSKDDAAVIDRTLQAIFMQEGPPFEVLSVDSGSRDETPAILARYPSRRFELPPERYVPGRVLNWMAREASGEVLVFVNSDATPVDSSWLSRLTGALEEDDSCAGVYGRQLPRPNATPWVRRDYSRAFPPPGTAAIPFIFSLANCAIRRAAWEQVAFDEHLLYSEDEDWARRVRAAGWTTRYVPEACVEHSHEYSLKQLVRRYRGEGQADAAIYAGAIPRRLSFSHLVLKTLVDALRDTKECATAGFWSRIPEALLRRSVQNAARWLGVREGMRSAAAAR